MRIKWASSNPSPQLYTHTYLKCWTQECDEVQLHLGILIIIVQ